MRKFLVGGVIVFLLGILLALGEVWWWAIAGFRVEIGYATGVTAAVLMVGGFAVAVSAETELDNERKRQERAARGYSPGAGPTS